MGSVFLDLRHDYCYTDAVPSHHSDGTVLIGFNSLATKKIEWNFRYLIVR